MRLLRLWLLTHPNKKGVFDVANCSRVTRSYVPQSRRTPEDRAPR